MMRHKIAGLAAVVGSLSVLAGCATTPPAYQTAFGAQNQVAGSSQPFQTSQNEALRAVLETLTSHGFTVNTADLADGVISAVGHSQDPHRKDVTYRIQTTITVTPLDPHTVEVGVAASGKRVIHQKTHTYFHLLWLVPIFPTGTQYHTVDRGSGVIRNAAFYHLFFQEVSQSLQHLQQAAAPDSAKTSGAGLKTTVTGAPLITGTPGAVATPPKSAVPATGSASGQMTPDATTP